MDNTLDVLKRIESSINDAMHVNDQMIKNPKTDYEHTAALWKGVGLHIALISVHDEMDKITGLGSGGS